MPAVMTAPFDPLGMLGVSVLQRRHCGGQPTLSSRPAQAGPGHKLSQVKGGFLASQAATLSQTTA
jgi:hypothetical protein